MLTRNVGFNSDLVTSSMDGTNGTGSSLGNTGCKGCKGSGASADSGQEDTDMEGLGDLESLEDLGCSEQEKTTEFSLNCTRLCLQLTEGSTRSRKDIPKTIERSPTDAMTNVSS